MLFAVAIENNTNPKITRKNNSPKINAKAVAKEDNKEKKQARGELTDISIINIILKFHKD